MPTLGIDIGGTSVKAALIDAGAAGGSAGSGGGTIRTGRSAEYANPSLETLLDAIRQAVPAGAMQAQQVGLCVPGLLDETKSRVRYSLNVPALQQLLLDEVLEQSIGKQAAAPRIFSDSHASAYGYWWDARPSGRLLAIALGTGVGACVLDDGAALKSTGEGCGHFGQIDVSLDDQAPLGSDGSRGTLEAYLGIRGLTQEFGPDFATRLGQLDSSSRALRALARGIRIAHAIYRPETVALLGFVGMKFAPASAALRSEIENGLTSVARKDWQLDFAHSPFLAAVGAARLAENTKQG